MASTAVSAAVEAMVEANWTQTFTPVGGSAPVAVPVLDANAGDSVPDANTPFLVIEYPIANEEQITIGAPGSNVFREEGAFRLVLCVPIGMGLSPYTQWLDDLRAVFRGRFFSGVTTWGASPPVTNDQSDRGAYFEISSSIPYRFDVYA